MRATFFLMACFGFWGSASAQIDGRFLSISVDPSRPLFGYVVEADASGNDFIDCNVGLTSTAGVQLRLTEITECPDAPNFRSVAFSLHDIVNGHLSSVVYDPETGGTHQVAMFGTSGGDWAGYFVSDSEAAGGPIYSVFELSQSTILVHESDLSGATITFIPRNPVTFLGNVADVANSDANRCLFHIDGPLGSTEDFPNDCAMVLETAFEEVYAIDRL